MCCKVTLRHASSFGTTVPAIRHGRTSQSASLQRMCNLYSQTRTRDAVKRVFRVGPLAPSASRVAM